MTTPSQLPDTKHATEIIKRFKALYQTLGAVEAESVRDQPLLEQVYSENIEFRDPLHSIHGLPSLRSYMDNMYGNVISCEFVFLAEWINETAADGKGSACIKWDMIFSHRKLAGGKKIIVRGVSHIRFGERIDYHEDVFDVGSMLYEHIPLMGKIILWLKGRLSH